VQVSILDSLLFGLSPRDPVTFVQVTALLAFAALTAAAIPGLRAARDSHTNVNNE
jgi:hypothetical protein